MTRQFCRNKTLGIVGYGDIGRATAGIGRAFRMKIVALRRRVQLSDDERKEGLQVLIFDAHVPCCRSSYHLTTFGQLCSTSIGSLMLPTSLDIARKLCLRHRCTRSMEMLFAAISAICMNCLCRGFMWERREGAHDTVCELFSDYKAV